MADVNGKPFLEHLLEYLEDEMVSDVTLSLGYKHEQVIDWIIGKGFTLKINWVIEKEALGTGGGIKLALNKVKNDKVFIINGDTFYKVNLAEMYQQNIADIKVLLALKPMKNFDRYGKVSLDENNYITAFHEKEHSEEGLINGGIYLLNRHKENLDNFPKAFSFEKDFLEKNVGNQQLKGMIADEYFMDIGVPEDYYQFQKDMQ